MEAKGPGLRQRGAEGLFFRHHVQGLRHPLRRPSLTTHKAGARLRWTAHCTLPMATLGMSQGKGEPESTPGEPPWPLVSQHCLTLGNVTLLEDLSLGSCRFCETFLK